MFSHVIKGLPGGLGCPEGYLGRRVLGSSPQRKNIHAASSPVFIPLTRSAQIDTAETSLLITEPYFNLPNIQEVYDQFVFEEYEFQSYLCSSRMFHLLPSRASIRALICTSRCTSSCGSDSAWSAILVPRAAEARMHARRGCRFQLHAHRANNGRQCRLVRGEKVCGLTRRGVRASYEVDGRIDVGGKLMTNHLKELVSFRQWNMMEETYIVNDVKEKCCYVSTEFAADLEACRFAPPVTGRPSRVLLAHSFSGPIRAGIRSSRNTCFRTSRGIGTATYASLRAHLLTASRYFTWETNASRFLRCCFAQTT